MQWNSLYNGTLYIMELLLTVCGSEDSLPVRCRNLSYVDADIGLDTDIDTDTDTGTDLTLTLSSRSRNIFHNHLLFDKFVQRSRVSVIVCRSDGLW